MRSQNEHGDGVRRASLVPASVRYVQQVARSGSIQRAARELNIAASAIDRQILRLEASLGVALFERVPRGMRLTAAGGAIVTMGQQWSADERHTAAQLQQLQGTHQGHVRLVVMDSHVNGFLPEFIGHLSDTHPDISLEVEIASTDAAMTSLVGGSADVAVAFNLLPRRELHALWTTELPFGCIVAPDHALARHAGPSLQQIAAHPIALQSRSLMIRRYLDARHAWVFATAPKLIETNSLQLVKLLAKSGRYAAFTSELDAAPEILDGSLVFLPVRDASAEAQTVSVVIDSRKSLPKVVRIVGDLLVGSVRARLEQVRGYRRPARESRPNRRNAPSDAAPEIRR